MSKKVRLNISQRKGEEGELVTRAWADWASRCALRRVLSEVHGFREEDLNRLCPLQENDLLALRRGVLRAHGRAPLEQN